MDENPCQSSATESTDASSLDGAEIRRGRVIVLCVIAFAVGFSLVVIVSFNVVSGTQRLPSQIVRFALTLGIAVCLYRGISWARYLLAALFAAAAVFAGITLPAMLKQATPFAVSCSAVAVLGYAASAVALLAFPSP